jgi:hypothetical protein
VVLVPDLADRRHTGQANLAHLAGGKPKEGELPLFRHELRHGTGGPDEARTLARLELDIVDIHAHRDVLQRERIAGSDLGFRPGHHLVSPSA